MWRPWYVCDRRGVNHCAATCLLLFAATVSDAQRRGRGQWQRGGTQPMAAGIRGGYDYDVERWSAGSDQNSARVAVPPGHSQW